MHLRDLQSASKPTMHFIGITTGQSSINTVFPLWVRHLRLGDCELRGMDLPLHADPRDYRAAVDFVIHDPLSLGALVTTHKMDLFAACQDQFEVIDPLSRSLGEISSIYKRDGQLHGRSVDPWTVGYALETFLPRDHWRSGAEALIFGAGGSGTALTWRLTTTAGERDRPSRVHVADCLPDRLEKLRALHATWPDAAPLEIHHVPHAAAADELLPPLPPGSLVVNATGAGKDTPGSPLTNAAIFPERAIAWEFNYRGNLVFLEQARAQQRTRNLQIEDGWIYFLHGWTRAIADVFNRDIPTHGAEFDELGRIASRVR